MLHRQRHIAAVFMGLALLAVSCGGGGEVPVGNAVDDTSPAEESSAADDIAAPDEPEESTEPPPPIEPGPKATLTGLPADESLSSTPAVVIKISNNDDRSLTALIGLDRADVVIEERIEDRATRFAAIFHSDLPELVGPVRSARTSDVDLMRNLGSPILVFSGANLAVLGEIRDLSRDGEVVPVVNDDSETYHYRDTDYSAPDNLFTDPTLVSIDFAEAAGAALPVLSFRNADSDTRSASIDGTGVTIEGRDIVSFVHHDGLGYVRVQDGAIHVTRDGVPLTVTNVVVMQVEYVTNADDAQSVDAATIGSGVASVLIDGRRWEGTWARVSAEEPYSFLDRNGIDVLLEPGTTWLTLVPQGSYEFAVEADIAGLVAGGAG